jgi:hypothetical protein
MPEMDVLENSSNAPEEALGSYPIVSLRMMASFEWSYDAIAWCPSGATPAGTDVATGRWIIVEFKAGRGLTGRGEAEVVESGSGEVPYEWGLITRPGGEVVVARYAEMSPCRVYVGAESEASGNSGTSPLVTADAEDIVDRLFAHAETQQEVFEDGILSQFGRNLERAVLAYGGAAVLEVTCLISTGRASAETAAEAVKWLGRITQSETTGWRIRAAEAALGHPSPLVRDSAAQALAAMLGKGALPALRTAATNESCVSLRGLLGLLVERLER